MYGYGQLAAAAIPALAKGVTSYQQAREAEELRKRDTTPAAFREALALGRQEASAALPGTGAELNRIDAGVDATLAAATRAGTSAQSVLGALSMADANRFKYLGDLATRTDAALARGRNNLTGLLAKEAGYQDRDQSQFDQSKAALREAARRNWYGALNDGSQVLSYGLGQSVPATVPGAAAADSSGLSPLGPDGAPLNPYYPDPYGRRGYRFGVPDPTGGFAPASGY